VSSASLSPRAAATRGRLVSAGLDLLSTRPIDAISVNEIVCAAGVAKGSFFNHFEDKAAFARQLAAGIRAEVETQVSAANQDERDPLLRLAGGMGVAVGFALAEPQRCSVMLRAMDWSIGADHPLNAGVVADLNACRIAGLTAEAGGGLSYWLGLCQVAMISALKGGRGIEDAATDLRDLLLLALRGLGCEPGRATEVADATAARLSTGDLKPL
jgi:AcrR family transcriptional regulator